jgi:tetratricopeptide (TPR) repeat protein
VFLLALLPAFGTPRVPSDDAAVLERVPAAAETRKLEPLRRAVATHPNDLKSALALAEGYLDIGRTTADPRFVSYAQAVLSPWLSRPQPDPVVLTWTAASLQYLHRFDEALVLLDRAIAAQSQNGQAWLMKATILQLLGRFQAARRACQPLTLASGQLIALVCLTSINSLTGRLRESYSALRSVYVDDPRLPLNIRIWILDELADMAWRAGDSTAAEQYWLAVLRAAPRDAYSKSSYADLLLQEHRETEVVRLLRVDEQQDNQLLRLAIAGTRLRTADGRRWRALFQARYEAALKADDFTHAREYARFLLEVQGDSAAALRLAARNWQIQREPADVRVYLAAAKASGNQPALQVIRQWLAQTGYEDRSGAADTSALLAQPRPLLPPLDGEATAP